MDDSEFGRMPNPFSPFAQDRSQRRQHLMSTAKLLLITVGLFVVASACQAYLHRAKLATLLREFSHSSKPEKQQQLQQLEESGADGVAGIVAAVGDSEDDISAEAADRLMVMGQRWLALPSDQQRAYQEVFAEALAELASQLDDPNDARFQRVQSLARQAVSQWMPLQTDSDATSADQNAVFATLSKVISGAESKGLPIAESAHVIDAPLPIDVASTGAATWTDWPPTSSTPKLYRRSVATLDVTSPSTAVLGQVQPASSTAVTETETAQIVKPSYRTATSVDEPPMRIPGGTTANTDYWITQLGSPSRHVRLRAVTELARRDDIRASEALRDHLPDESDHGVALSHPTSPFGIDRDHVRDRNQVSLGRRKAAPSAS